MPATRIGAPEGIDLSGFSLEKTKKIAVVKNQTKMDGLQVSTEEVNSSNHGSTTIGSTTTNQNGPVFLKFVQPPYPPVARAQGIEGIVKIKAFYNQEGMVTNVEIIQSSGAALLDETVKKTALKWQITKPLTSGNFEQSFAFKLRN